MTKLPGGWLTTQEAADELGLTHDAIRQAIKRQTLPASALIPGRNFIKRSDLEAYRKSYLRGPRPRKGGDET